MERRRFLLFFPAAVVILAAEENAAEDTIRGKLVQPAAGDPTLEAAGGKRVLLTGDPDTVAVLKDARLANADFEVVGRSAGAGRFEINPIHKRALFAYKNGHKLMVTYWCDVCAIRTYTPGICWCCREETALDLIEPDKVSKE